MMEDLPQDLVDAIVYRLAEAYADGIVETAFPKTPFYSSLQERADAIAESVMSSDRKVVLESRARYLLSDILAHLP